VSTRDTIIEVISHELHLHSPEDLHDAMKIGVNGLGLDSIQLMHLLSVLNDRTDADLLDQIADVAEMSLGELVERVDAQRST
jgi:acyl carrier protein